MVRLLSVLVTVNMPCLLSSLCYKQVARRLCIRLVTLGFRKLLAYVWLRIIAWLSTFFFRIVWMYLFCSNNLIVLNAINRLSKDTLRNWFPFSEKVNSLLALRDTAPLIPLEFTHVYKSPSAQVRDMIRDITNGTHHRKNTKAGMEFHVQFGQTDLKTLFMTIQLIPHIFTIL